MASRGSKLTFNLTDLDHFSARVFLDFPRKMGFRVSGTKKKNRRRITSVKKSENDFGGFPDFSSMCDEKTRRTSMRIIFPPPPQPPKSIQTCYDNRFLGFLAWEVSKVHASFRTAGTVVCLHFNFVWVFCWKTKNAGGARRVSWVSNKIWRFYRETRTIWGAIGVL